MPSPCVVCVKVYQLGLVTLITLSQYTNGHCIPFPVRGFSQPKSYTVCAASLPIKNSLA